MAGKGGGGVGPGGGGTVPKTTPKRLGGGWVGGTIPKARS